ncbi:n6-DNA-methyltransferase, putative [Talaromyces stipitatus ATCC 10500]|uniref:N6-DNA-methyltransferase, putative n=1 Tax=Talaromyces stipitatus (strain ATCC 10500 / CBS 375.48 / QM 6759 / NRRL 1006) TaxID=441959 RepID=B8MTS0_TALSN|nr:n6-DNA-methyltransferase, putative [Talaromyces stipitatus ATCC 10500]EED12555.1 n6-DNA-methyltransferase, putative [Talaromyces stipitatus ATCC 10500]
MPRIPTRLVLKAYKENPLLLDLLKECRTLENARNELRWLREGAIAKFPPPGTSSKGQDVYSTHTWQRELRKMCDDRSKGKPLQYILGDQPFGDLDILCRKGVLIPRGETESFTFHTRDVILEAHSAKYLGKSLRILDLCSGSGCISLLLHSLLASHFKDLTIVGVDVDPRAISLSQKNKLHNIRRGLLSPRAQNEVCFLKADILDSIESGKRSFLDTLQPHFPGSNTQSTWDVLISNPPYISTSNFCNGTTSRSVRKYEPVRALVPPIVHSPFWKELGFEHVAREDIFYVRLLSLIHQLHVKITVLECGDLEQARRIMTMAEVLSEKVGANGRQCVYIWNDGCAVNDNDGGARAVIIESLL